MKTKYLIAITAVAALLAAGCSDDRMYSPSDGSARNPVNIKASIDQLNLTRADDSGFADGDRIGIYMADFENGMPAALKTSGNHADNIPFTFDGNSFSWNSPTSLFFKDGSTSADFYGYYPYRGEISDVETIPFSVQANQASEASGSILSGYEKSDLLWAKSAAVSPSSNVINLLFNHILAGIEVRLVEGDGFDTGEWSGLHKSVMVDGTVRDGVFNLAAGIVKATGTADDRAIIANPAGESFRAVVLPQSVGAGNNLVVINVGSDSYRFKRDAAMDYVGGKLHKFTFKVSKKQIGGTYGFELISEAVTVWESDPSSHDGLGKAYQVVEIEKGQRLEEVLTDMSINPKEVVNLKLKGFLDGNDFYFIRDNMRKIQALNLKEVRIKGIYKGNYEEIDDCIPSCALTNCVTLKHIVFPDKLKRIEELAFGGTILEGSLKIPEGVVYIGDYAFTNNNIGASSIIPGGTLSANKNLTGTLELPSTLEYIGEEAFRACDFNGRLILPSSLKFIGSGAFCGCRNFSGDIRLPESLEKIERGAFSGTIGIGGTLEIPEKLKVIEGFDGMNVSQIIIPENSVEIGSHAFYGTKVRGEIVIHDKVTNIGDYAFYNCNATSISLPSGLTRINASTFARCTNLADTLTIPRDVEVIDNSAFYGCSKIEELVLPEKLNYISEDAFSDCLSLQYIHCNAKEPPVLAESAFNGVNKDNFTVEVPEESVNAYRNAPGWSEFKRIAAYKNFVARPSKYNVLNKGGKKEIILNADDSWELVSCPSWCHVDKTSGSGKTALTLTVDRMSNGSPVRNGEVVFRLSDSGEYRTYINVCQYDYEHEEDSYVQLQKATRGQGIDLFLVGDGYDAADISSGLLMKDMKQTMEYFFGVEPYTTYRDYFNVYTGIALSEVSGIEELNKWRNTKFHTRLTTINGGISADWQNALEYCAETCDPIVSKPDSKVGVILLANYDGYDGVTYSIDDSFCAVVTKSALRYPYDARGLVQHEAGGHGIGWLADEYIYHDDFIQRCKCACCEHVDEILAFQSRGGGLNLSLNGKYKEVPWSHLIFNPSYGDIADVYEGGYFHRRGVYRSEYNSCMNNNVPYFSTWSRQLIVQRIMKLAGEQFSLEKFYANDKRDMGRDFTTSRSPLTSAPAPMHGNPPVFISNYKFGKKGGKR